VDLFEAAVERDVRELGRVLPERLRDQLRDRLASWGLTLGNAVEQHARSPEGQHRLQLLLVFDGA